MNRFFVDKRAVDIQNREIEITGEDVKHISTVLRLTPGEMIEVCDGEATQYLGQIIQLDRDRVRVAYQEAEPVASEPSLQVVLYQGVPKGDKMELILQKTVELGVAAIVPVLTKRTVVQFPNQKERDKKAQRWQKIAIEAAKQSKRGRIPQVYSPMSFREALAHAKANGVNLLAYEGEQEQSLKAVLRQPSMVQTKGLGIWIGPEGGFEQEEAALAKEGAFYSVTLGPRILRTETAGLALLTMVLYELGDLGGY